VLVSCTCPARAQRESSARNADPKGRLRTFRRAGGNGRDLRPRHLNGQARTMESRVLNILLVEDDEVDVMNVQRAFTKNNIRNPLYIAGNGIEALELLRGEEMPKERRIILLDLNMPRMNGIEFLRELRADPAISHTPVVVLTTSNDERDKVEAYNLNVAGYLLKPVTFGNFCEVMATLNKYWTLVEMP
jgi:CheY-like chemotaxis protein